MDQERIKRFWEDRAKSDAFLWRDLSKLNAEFTNKYLKPNFSLLDLGCGDGSSTVGLDHNPRLTLVDYVLPQNMHMPSNGVFIKEDLRTFTTDQKFDLITLYGVANSFSKEDMAKIYHKCYDWLFPNGILLVKHQCGKTEDVIVDTYSEQLGSDYLAYYHSVENCQRMLRRAGFEVETTDPYPPEYNKWENTLFKAFICRKNAVIPYNEYFGERSRDETEWFAMYERRKKSVRSKDDKWNLLHTVKQTLDANDIPFYLMYGTLLGAVREKDFIEWDGDVDIGILGRFQTRLLNLVDHIKPFKLLRIIDKYYCSLVHNDEFIDIYTFLEGDKKYLWCCENRHFDEEKEVLDNPSKIMFRGEEFLTVKNPAESLTRWYGDWTTPKKKVSEWKIH